MAAFFRFWTRQAEARPFTTIAATEACLSACGDLIAQTVGSHLGSKQEAGTGYDLWRTARFMVFSTCISPVGVRWHRFLDHRFPIRSQTTWFRSPARRKKGAAPTRAKRKAERRTAAAQVGKRLACDVLIYEPIMYATFFSSMALMEGGSLDDAARRVAHLLPPTYLTGLTISPIVQTINFAFVPLIYRVPFGSCFDLFWDTYLSWVNSEKGAPLAHH
ncbi:hypothetical protein IWQ56_004883 [Coemansia nantahalensis]|uniref:Uncharacterized protein n=1 Tax=Coemansia nantahalensis TaxID=2789366 RepID=A0ACC1K5C4_9FUNG|nr:hypothetical protein IWQ56_004883 [Coemansia nantahalensis]KAJ2773765.1 hypothetical protein IWQ57_001144 [Coemansia nantahalensis]